jgi:hypothetical protein
MLKKCLKFVEKIIAQKRHKKNAKTNGKSE